MKSDRLFALIMLISSSVTASDLVELKRVQYQRLLRPPQESALDSDALLRFLDSSDFNRQSMYSFERIMDCRSFLYAVTDRINHQGQEDAAVRHMLSEGYKAVNTLNLTGAVTTVKALAARMATPDRDGPLADCNAFGWLKNFTQWGFVKHPEGMIMYEPDPWNLTWQDGFEMNVAQDCRVSTARCIASEPRYRETRYEKPMSDVSVERSWTSTTWQLKDRRVTFSVLTPVIDIDGVRRLTLSGFPSAPDRLSWIARSGQWRGLKLTDRAAFEPQVVASAVQDFGEPPPPVAVRAIGVQKINPDEVDRPWMILSAEGMWSLIILPGARPVAAGWNKGVFEIRFARETYVGLLKAPGNLHSHEYPGVAEFFAGVAAAYPRSCRWIPGTDSVGWRYSFEHRENDWMLDPQEIASMPPLADFAGMQPDGQRLRRTRYPTKWGCFSYVDGAELRCRSVSRRESADVLRGVNVGVFQEKELCKHVASGAKWVRLVLDARRSLEENLLALEDVIRNPEFSSARFLVDPHGLEYFIGWKKGIPGSNGEAKCQIMWERIAEICSRYPTRLAGYDLYNEPGVVDGAEGRWRAIATRIVKTIREYDATGMIYYSGVYGGNANGLFNLKPIADESKQSFTFHFYSPHSFTHQKCQSQKGDDPFVWYPGWAPQVDWTRRIHYGGTSVHWHDRWTLAALMLPALEASAEFGIPLHCGEFSVVGYANAAAGRSAYIWTRDVMEILEHKGVSWNIWNWGYGMCNPDVADYVQRCWKSKGNIR